MAHKPYPLEPESESCRHATQPGTSFPDKYELAGKLGTVVKQAGESSILIMLDSGGEWRIDLDRVAVTSHSIGCRSWRSDMQMVPFRLNLFGLLALWLQRLTYTEAKGGPGFDSGTSRPQRRRGEGRSADAPRLVHCPRQRGCKNLSGDAHKFEPRYVVVFRFNVRLSVAPGPAAVTPKERKSSGSLVPGF
jgi:hypothetical protein